MLSSLIFSVFASVAKARNFTFDESNVALNGSLYQSTYLDGNIYATSSVGRVVNESYIFKVNADSLELLETTLPDRENTSNLLWAVYGTKADTKNKRVWVTNTRLSTVSAYDDNLNLLSHLPVNTTSQSRDIVVDERNGKVYSSSSTSGNIGVYDAKDLTYLSTINLATSQQPFKGVMQLVIDSENDVLYTVSLQSNVAAGVDLSNNNKVTYYQLGNATSASAVAYDNTRRHLFVASQKSDEILVIDTKDNAKATKRSIQLPNTLAKRAAHDDVQSEIHVADGSLYAGYEPKNDLLYVVNRIHSDLYVIDAGSLEILTTIKTGKLPNHIAFDPSGNVYVVDKDTPSRLHRYSPRSVNNSTASPSGAKGGNQTSPAASSSGKGGKGGNPAVSNGVSPVLIGAGVAVLPALALLI